MIKHKRGCSNAQGFTLIELLIVIVLISILSVLVINVIDPEYQMKVAKDAVLVASMNKLILSTEAFVSSYNRVPDEAEFFDYLDQNASELPGGSCSYNLGPDYECLFSIEGVGTPETCDLSRWTGADVNDQTCNFRYQGEIMSDSSRFRIYVKSNGLPNKVLAYDNKEGGIIFECPHTIADFNVLSDECGVR